MMVVAFFFFFFSFFPLTMDTSRGVPSAGRSSFLQGERKSEGRFWSLNITLPRFNFWRQALGSSDLSKFNLGLFFILFYLDLL